MSRKSAMTPAQIVEGVRNNQPEAHEALYALLQKSPRYRLWKDCGAANTEDYLHDVYIIALQAIRAGQIRVPEAFRLFIKTLVNRRIAQHINAQVQTRNREVPQEDIDICCSSDSPERMAINRQHDAIISKALKGVSKTDREIMQRFYKIGETRKEVCVQMGLSETQFRLRKSRAKATVVKQAKKTVGGGRLNRLIDLAAA